MQEHNPYVPNVHFEQIPIKNLVSNQEYQRNISQSHVENAAAHFDLYQINPVKVSRRGGINYVFNGQHTIEIVALVSGSRDTPVWCMISANVLNGIVHLVVTYGDSLKDDQFQEKLGAVSIKQLIRTARERRPGSLGYAEAMLLEYNRKCRHTLSMKKLYEKDFQSLFGGWVHRRKLRKKNESLQGKGGGSFYHFLIVKSTPCRCP